MRSRCSSSPCWEGERSAARPPRAPSAPATRWRPSRCRRKPTRRLSSSASVELDVQAARQRRRRWRRRSRPRRAQGLAGRRGGPRRATARMTTTRRRLIGELGTGWRRRPKTTAPRSSARARLRRRRARISCFRPFSGGAGEGWPRRRSAAAIWGTRRAGVGATARKGVFAGRVARGMESAEEPERRVGAKKIRADALDQRRRGRAALHAHDAERADEPSPPRTTTPAGTPAAVKPNEARAEDHGGDAGESGKPTRRG